MPVHERGEIPHWTRWEATATTFGPRGRIIATVLVFATLIPALFSTGIVYAITVPVVAAVLLREIWAKGWYVPEAETSKGERAPKEPAPQPARSEPTPISVVRTVRWALGIAAVVAFTYGPIELKAAVVGFAGIALLIWFWTRFDYR